MKSFKSYLSENTLAKANKILNHLEKNDDPRADSLRQVIGFAKDKDPEMRKLMDLTLQAVLSDPQMKKLL